MARAPYRARGRAGSAHWLSFRSARTPSICRSGQLSQPCVDELQLRRSAVASAQDRVLRCPGTVATRAGSDANNPDLLTASASTFRRHGDLQPWWSFSPGSASPRSWRVGPVLSLHGPPPHSPLHPSARGRWGLCDRLPGAGSSGRDGRRRRGAPREQAAAGQAGILGHQPLDHQAAHPLGQSLGQAEVQLADRAGVIGRDVGERAAAKDEVDAPAPLARAGRKPRRVISCSSRSAGSPVPASSAALRCPSCRPSWRGSSPRWIAPERRPASHA